MDFAEIGYAAVKFVDFAVTVVLLAILSTSTEVELDVLDDEITTLWNAIDEGHPKA